MRTRGTAALAAVLTGLATVVAVNVVTPAAHAAAGWYLWINVNSKMALQANSRSNGAGTQQQPRPSGEPSQLMQWKVFDVGSYNGHRLVAIRNAGTSNWYALAISGGGTADGNNAIVWTYGASAAEQKWELIPVLTQPALPPTYVLKNFNSDKCLAVPGSSTVAGTKVIQWACNGLRDQQWTLREAV